jgi:hypothetical protein
MSEPDYISWAFCGLGWLMALVQVPLGMRLLALLRDIVEQDRRLLEENERLRGDCVIQDEEQIDGDAP